ncbi:TlpA disulfide reductase family protein [Aneurinibacillus sp. Ricciae_BoGa-3]|uniref:TlpA family protein disulfide reductase n=1 Tax=Aneurinibacillus sp. Ricciae_BoGa-3 TaxID=3022697 RepID=UPI00233F8FA6|nr:TlpA disulfide reductase family protein [Aneurinibacillus sp. Ricciae_BoGa-3]WCK54887.1 TlpA disulfide reductase family protein [Aneurinibacillus sp. Ricciae_BoGa-3]
MKSFFTIMILLVLVGAAMYRNHPAGNKAVVEKPSYSSSIPVTEKAEIGFRAPRFILDGLDGEKYSLKNLNKPVVINFWASWCGPCRDEAPELTKLYSQYQDKVQVYGVNLRSQDDLNDVHAFVNAFNVKFPVLLDKTDDVSKRFSVQAIPTTYFVNSKGVIVGKTIGLVSPNELRTKFKSLVEK